MPNYNNTVIYKIKHNEDYDDLNIYVGSTTNFRGRKNQHKSCCNNENSKKFNINIYRYIRDNGGWDQFVMVLIEEYSCNSNNEKQIRERYHIDILKPKLNCNIPCRTLEEWKKDNKEILSKKLKDYKNNNKEKIKEKDKQYRDNNKEQAKKRSKKHHQNNKETINATKRENYKNNKHERLQKITCQCGSIVAKMSIKRHEQSLKHKNFILALNKE